MCSFFSCSQAIAVICVMLHYNTMELEFDAKMNIVVTGTFFGYAIICGVLLIGNNFDFRFIFHFFVLWGPIWFRHIGQYPFNSCAFHSIERRACFVCNYSSSIIHYWVLLLDWTAHIHKQFHLWCCIEFF